MQMTQFGVLCWSAALIVTMSLPAVAQQPGAPGGGQGRGQGRGGGQRGGFGGRGGGQLTLANVPVEALAKSLGLSADQKTKIEAIQTKHREETRALFPRGGRGGPGGGGGPGGTGARPGGPGGPGAPGGAAPGGAPGARPGGPGGPGGPGADPAFAANMEKLRGMNAKATASIEAVLTAPQKTKVPGLVKEFQALRGARIPLEVAADLKLTPDQIKRIEAVSDEQRKKMQAAFQGAGQGGDRTAMREKFQAMRTENQQKIEAILTADQKAAVKKYEDAHPRPQRGGGGRGGGGGRIT